MTKGLNELFLDLDALERNSEGVGLILASKLVDNLVGEVNSYPSIDTGRYLLAIDKHELMSSAGFDWLIDASENSEVTYDGFLEFETYNPGRKTKRAARWHNKKAIEGTNFVSVFDTMVDSSMGHSLLI